MGMSEGEIIIERLVRNNYLVRDRLCRSFFPKDSRYCSSIVIDEFDKRRIECLSRIQLSNTNVVVYHFNKNSYLYVFFSSESNYLKYIDISEHYLGYLKDLQPFRKSS